MADTKLKGKIELEAEPINVKNAAASLKDAVAEAFQAGASDGLGVNAGGLGATVLKASGHLGAIGSGLKGSAQNLSGLLRGALGSAETGTTGGLIGSASGLIEGLGVAALGGAGMAALGMVATIGFIKALGGATTHLLHFNESLGGGMGAMGAVEGILDMQNKMLQLQVGSKLAPSTLKLGEAWIGFKTELENDFVPDIKLLNNSMVDLIHTIQPAIPYLAAIANHLIKGAVGVAKVAGESASVAGTVWKDLGGPWQWHAIGKGASEAGGILHGIGRAIGTGTYTLLNHDWSKWGWSDSTNLGPSKIVRALRAKDAAGVHAPSLSHPHGAQIAHVVKRKQQADEHKNILEKIAKHTGETKDDIKKTNRLLEKMSPQSIRKANGFLTFIDGLANVHPKKGQKADRQQMWEEKFEKQVSEKHLTKTGNPHWMKRSGLHGLKPLTIKQLHENEGT